MNRKSFIDIQHIREQETELKKSNIGAFEVGNHIVIQEKFDGSCACIAYDKETDSMAAFSRRQTLDMKNALNGFWNFVQQQDKSRWIEDDGIYCFGEWSNKNKIKYDLETKHFFVFDVYDSKREQWMPQDFVKQFAAEHDLEYIHVLYDGPFISWEHCKSFMNMPHYGKRQEGIVVKNIDKMNNENNYLPAYLKIVNSDFKETRDPKPIDIEKLNSKNKSMEIAQSIITEARVQKMLFKLRDENVLPEKLSPEDMSLIARNLPKRIYEDCVKEEPEYVTAAGEYFGKACGSITMVHARNLICK